MAIAFVLCSQAFGANQPSSEPAAAGANDEPRAVLVFRKLAMFPAERTRIYLSEAGDAIDQESRTEVVVILEEYARKVDAAAHEVRQNPPGLHALVERAQGTFAEAFELDVLENWLEVHPATRAEFNRIEAVLHGTYSGMENLQQILAAAGRSGLPEASHQQARRVLDDAYGASMAFGKRIVELQQEASRLPKDDPRYLEHMTILTDVELHKLRTAQIVRKKLRELIPAQRHAEFDEELAKLAEGK